MEFLNHSYKWPIVEIQISHLSNSVKKNKNQNQFFTSLELLAIKIVIVY